MHGVLISIANWQARRSDSAGDGMAAAAYIALDARLLRPVW
jgi:hypothetical protein